MKITSLSFPLHVTEDFGLQPIEMSRLTNIIIVAGKNGAGKTRFFKLLKSRLNEYPTKAEIAKISYDLNNAKNAHSHYNEIVQKHSAEINTLQSSPGSEVRINKLKGDILNYETSIRSWEDKIAEFEKKLRELPFINITPEKQHGSIVDFVPTSLNLQDSYDLTERNLDVYASKIYSVGTNELSSGVIPAIHKIVRRYINVQLNVDLQVSSQEKIKIEKDYERLKEYISIFLGTELTRNADGHPMIFGKRIGEAQLSDGQKILLQFCLAIYAQESSLDNLIVFMDEPENHLHPGALVYVLDTIARHIANGQLWISTHSVNVLAHFDPSSISYIDNGKISYAGNVPQNVLKSLLGTDEEIERLSAFLSLPAQMASIKFAYESLFYPKVILTGTQDPQINQIKKIINELKSTGQKLKILDYGVGKNRLLATIAENERLEGNEVNTWLEMYGFDIDPCHKDICLKVYEKVYGSSDGRYYNDAKELLLEHDENSFDLIVMTNVLHEIEPKDWLSVFTSAHSIFPLLKDKEYLIIVEDQLLAVGEKAHSKGFLVLDSLELKKLFKISSTDDYKVYDERGDGRLKAHFIPKDCINRIDSESRKQSIESLLASSKENIKRIRLLQQSYKAGKMHAFWTQQLANASLAVEEL